MPESSTSRVVYLAGKLTGIEVLVSANAKPAKRGPAPKIQQQLERVSQLPRARQRMVSEVLDSLLAQAR